MCPAALRAYSVKPLVWVVLCRPACFLRERALSTKLIVSNLIIGFPRVQADMVWVSPRSACFLRQLMHPLLLCYTYTYRLGAGCLLRVSLLSSRMQPTRGFWLYPHCTKTWCWCLDPRQPSCLGIQLHWYKPLPTAWALWFRELLTYIAESAVSPPECNLHVVPG